MNSLDAQIQSILKQSPVGNPKDFRMEIKEMSKKLQKKINESERKLQEQILQSLHYSRNVYEAVEKLRQDLPMTPANRHSDDSLSEQ